MLLPPCLWVLPSIVESNGAYTQVPRAVNELEPKLLTRIGQSPSCVNSSWRSAIKHRGRRPVAGRRPLEGRKNLVRYRSLRPARALNALRIALVWRGCTRHRVDFQVVKCSDISWLTIRGASTANEQAQCGRKRRPAHGSAREVPPIGCEGRRVPGIQIGDGHRENGVAVEVKRGAFVVPMAHL